MIQQSETQLWTRIGTDHWINSMRKWRNHKGMKRCNCSIRLRTKVNHIAADARAIQELMSPILDWKQLIDHWYRDCPFPKKSSTTAANTTQLNRIKHYNNCQSNLSGARVANASFAQTRQLATNWHRESAKTVHVSLQNCSNRPGTFRRLCALHAAASQNLAPPKSWRSGYWFSKLTHAPKLGPWGC